MTDRLSSARLTMTLRKLAAANTEAQRLREMISMHSIEVYGVDPADVDCDSFIDACDGGGGACRGMTALEFDKAMRDAMQK